MWQADRRAASACRRAARRAGATRWSRDAERGRTTEQELWALARLGARVPIYGPLNCVVRARARRQRVVERLLAARLAARRTRTAFAVAQIARASGDRERDLEPALRERVARRLERAAGRRAARPHRARAGGARGARGGAAARRVAARRAAAAGLDRRWTRLRTSRTLVADAESAHDAMRAGIPRRLAVALRRFPRTPPGAVAVYLYYTYVDPLGARPAAADRDQASRSSSVITSLLVISPVLGDRWTRRRPALVAAPARRRVARAEVPLAVRRRVLNAALMNGLL